jgi:ketosteroid isomerase-like protein
MRRSTLAVLVLLFVFLFQTGPALPDQPPVKDAAGDSAIIAREKAVWEAIRMKQIEKLRSLMAPDYSAIYPFGYRDLQKELDHSGTGYLVKYSLEPLQATHPNSTLAILLYRATATIVDNGQEKPITLHASSVWVKQDSVWKIVFHTAIPMAN